MTPKQEERIRKKIAEIKKELADDKKQWGGFYHDGKGLRYLPPGYFIKLTDYRGGLRYLNWFSKTFPDDIGYPVFLFEWIVILFKTGEEIEAKKKALQTFFSNTYLLDKFLEKEFLHFDKWEGSNWERVSLTEDFSYTKNDEELIDFAIWLESFIISEEFFKKANEFIEIMMRLKNEQEISIRGNLVKRLHELVDEN